MLYKSFEIYPSSRPSSYSTCGSDRCAWEIQLNVKLLLEFIVDLRSRLRPKESEEKQPLPF